MCITDVASALHILTQPTDTSAAAPFSALFEFSIQVYSYQTIHWYKNNEISIPKKAYLTLIPSVKETTSILTIPNVTMQ